MKKTLLFLMGILCLWTANAQSFQHNAVVPAAGTNSTATISLEWTLGDLATSSFTLGESLFTQGFNQPFINSLKNDPIVNAPEIRMLPNPTSSFVQVVVDDQKQGMYLVSITDITGRNAIDRTRLFVSKISINVASLAAGSYLVTVYNSAGVRVQTRKLIKL
jgi:hypothetical protein